MPAAKFKQLSVYRCVWCQWISAPGATVVPIGAFLFIPEGHPGCECRRVEVSHYVRVPREAKPEGGE
jgi:hypothetical protein